MTHRPPRPHLMMRRPVGGLVPLFCLLALAAFFALPAPPAFAQEQPAGSGLDAAEMGGADRPRRYVYGYDRAFPPFSYEREGKVEGFDIELLRAVLEGQNVRLLPRPLEWEEVLLELSAGNVQVSSGMIKTEQRKLLYEFAERPVLPLKARFFMKDFKRVANISQLQAKRVGVKKDSLYETMLKMRGGIIVVPFPTDLEALEALQAEQVDAYFGADRTAFFLFGKVGIQGISPVGTPLAVVNVYYAVYREDKELARMIDAGLRRVRESGEYDRIFRRWFVKEVGQDRIKELVARATEASAFAYAPYSGQAFGAAVLGRTGAIYTGCNVENGLSQLNASALQVAVHNAVAAGESDYLAAVNVRSDGTAVAPSAEERRLLFEFGPEILVVTETRKGVYETLMVTQLLPYPQEQESETVLETVN